MMILDNVENITDNMNYVGYEGKWYSYIDNLNIYRIRYLDDEFTIWLVKDTEQILADNIEVRPILRSIRRTI